MLAAIVLYLIFLSEQELKKRTGFDSSALLVTYINHESASPNTSLPHTIFFHAQLLAYSRKRTICTPAEEGKEL